MPQVSLDQAIQIALQHHRQGQLPQAEVIYRQILAAQPNHHDALQLLGAIAFQAGKYEAAVELIGKAAVLAPSQVHYHSNLGMALQRLGRHEEASAAFARAIAIDANHADAHASLGDIRLEQGRWEEAIGHYRAALRIKPALVAVHNNLAHALHNLGRSEQAIESYRDAIRYKADFAEAHGNLGGLLLETGQVFEAIENLRGALVLKPQLAFAHSNLLYALHFDPGISPQVMLDEHLNWARRHAEPLRGEIRPHENDRDPARRLRIGYVSQDLRDHPVGRFMLPVLEAHDRREVDVQVYCDVAHADSLTERLRRHAEGWHDVRKLDDAALAERVRSDRIDILIDLSGHAGVNRLLTFARKPAPVQVTYLGYPDTTGMSAMDYRITDENADPAGMTERFHTERLIRLPGGFFCYRPAEELPDVASPPCEVTGQVTFGSFNNLAKVSADVIALWARILGEIPISRLMIKSLALNDEPTRRRIRRAFAAHGIDSRRLDLRGREVTYRQHLAMYAGIDIALDTFPYHGTTTTCEALAMGVPVVTLAGRTHASRVGVSILTRAWLEEWIAKDADEYIFKAVSLASDPARLQALRRVLRDQLFNSSLGDANALARHLEEAYREMWRKWCAGDTEKADAPQAHTP